MSDNESRLRKALEGILEVRSHMNSAGRATFNKKNTLLNDRMDAAEKVLKSEHPCPRCGCLWFKTLSTLGPDGTWLRVCRHCGYKHGPYERMEEDEA